MDYFSMIPRAVVSSSLFHSTSPDHGTLMLRMLSLCSSSSAISGQNMSMLAVSLLFLVMGTWVLVGLLAWGHPGGFAWGLHSLRVRSCSSKPADTTQSPSLIPGPRGLPFFGSLLAFTGNRGKCAHRVLAALAAAYKARPLMAFSLGSTRVVVSSDPCVARQILCNAAFTERPLTTSARRLLFGRSIGFSPSGDRWRNLRRICAAHLFNPRRIAAHERIRQLDCTAMLDAMAQSLKRGSVLHVRPYLQHAALNNIMETVFGKRFEFADMNANGAGEAAEVQKMVREGFELLGAFNFSDHLPSAFDVIDALRVRQRCDNLVPKVFAYVQAIIAEHRCRRQAKLGTSSLETDNLSRSAHKNDDGDFVDALLALEAEEKLTDSDMVSILWEMVFRGTDTMAILTEWILAELVLHSDVQAKLYAEIREVVREEGDIRDSDARQMPYLQAVVQEGLRMHLPGPLLSWARVAVHDTEVAGHLIPEGTTAMVNMWAITHDKTIWEDPETFMPERFLSKGEREVATMIGGGVDLRLAPFGAGARACPGKALAMATVSLWLARIVQCFQITQHPLHPVQLTEVLKLSCEMEVPLVACFIPRR
ncbi:hypothetical protein KP509_33G033600 [Ceratopteris richardii]|uniref:Cytochrome P450 n=1 Tax=Ceratopteris richardii TaxID=49495 RepID=A0A8T2QPS5_CERRI|nr:hypothetical protein KP509_33G033600 [Ceratopteris richardii]